MRDRTAPPFKGGEVLPLTGSLQRWLSESGVPWDHPWVFSRFVGKPSLPGSGTVGRTHRHGYPGLPVADRSLGPAPCMCFLFPTCLMSYISLIFLSMHRKEADAFSKARAEVTKSCNQLTVNTMLHEHTKGTGHPSWQFSFASYQRDQLCIA